MTSPLTVRSLRQLAGELVLKDETFKCMALAYFDEDHPIWGVIRPVIFPMYVNSKLHARELVLTIPEKSLSVRSPAVRRPPARCVSISEYLCADQPPPDWRTVVKLTLKKSMRMVGTAEKK